MAILICEVLLLFIFFVILRGSQRTLKLVYQPCGPKMCAELSQDLAKALSFTMEDLSCHRDLNTASDNDSYTCPENKITTIGRTKCDGFPGCRIGYNPPEGAPTGDRRLVLEMCDKTLHKACEMGNICVVQYILSNGLADINCVGKLNRTPVMSAARKGQAAVFDFLVSHCCDLLAKDYHNDNVLHLASFGGNTNIVRKLVVNEQFDMDRRGRSGWTPVMGAANYGRREVFDFLVGQGCNVTLTDNDRDNILHLACLISSVDMVNHILSKKIIDIESRGKRGRTPLLGAASLGRVGVVKRLLGKGCNETTADDSNDNILYLACISGSVDAVKYILSRHVINIDSKGKYGKTPVMKAVSLGRVEVVKYLKSKGCNMSAVDASGNNILHLSGMRGHTETVKYLLQLEVIDLRQKNKYGNTPLSAAMFRGRTKVVSILKEWKN